MTALPPAFAAIFDADPRASLVVGTDGTVLAANHRYLSLLDLRSDEPFVGESLHDGLAAFLTASDLAALQSSLARVRQLRASDVTDPLTYTLLSGAFPFGTQQTPVVSDGELSYILHQLRGSETQLVQRQAPSSEVVLDPLRHVVDGSPYAVAMFDREMRYLFASPRWLADYQLPFSSAELLGRSHYQVFPEIPAHWREIHRRGLSGELIREEAEAFRREDGTLQWLRWEVRPWRGTDSEVRGILIYTEDVSAAKRALDESRRWEYAFRNVSWGLSLATADERISYVNPAFARMHGTRPEVWEGRAWADMLSAASRERLPALTQQLHETGHLTYESDHVRADGTIFPVITEVSELKDQLGNVLFSVASYRDHSAHKQAEQFLLASEARFRGTFENAAVGIAHVGLEGQWLRVNDKLCSIVDYTREELLKLTFQDITHPDDLEADLAFVHQVVSGEIQTYSMEKRYFRGDGAMLWINLTVSLMRSSAGAPDYFISIIEDISARKSVASALHESEARFRTLANNIPQLAWMADQEGARFWFNRRWLDYTGSSLEASRAWQWASVYRSEDRERLVSDYRARCALGYAWTETCELLDAAGEARWFLTQVVPLRNDDNHIIRWLGTHTDVTAEREAERATERARFFELSLDLVCITNSSGELLHVSPGFSKTLGFSLQELDRRSVLELAHDDEREAMQRALRQIRETATACELTSRFRRSDGSYRWLQWRWAASADGLSYAIARDVTADRELLESLQRAERELRDKQASLTAGLREREVLLQEIHHRVKNNLQVISSLINMQARRLDVPSARSALEECKTRVEAIALIHEQLYQSKDYREIPFGKYVQLLIQSITSMSGVAGRRVMLDVHTESVALPVDKAIPCGLILNELITNALKHAYPDGRAGEVRVSLRQLDGQLALVVADDGIGMSKTNGTTGSLGMQLIETLVEQIHGELTTTDANGMTFQVMCPLR